MNGSPILQLKYREKIYQMNGVNQLQMRSTAN